MAIEEGPMTRSGAGGTLGASISATPFAIQSKSWKLLVERARRSVSDAAKRLIKVRDDIFNGFDPHGDADDIRSGACHNLLVFG